MLAASLLSLLLPQSDPLGASRDLAALLRAAPRFERFVAVLDAARANRLQILLSEPVAHDGRIVLRRSRLGDPEQYFYPASAIKICGAVAALLRLNAHNADHGTAFGLDTRLTIEPRFAGDARIDRDASNVDDGLLTVRHMLRKMLLVSDNGAYNHCLEVVGADGLNRSMWDAGFASVRLWHRLSERRSLQENRQTRGVVLRDGGRAVTLPARDAGVELSNQGWDDLEVGAGYMRDGRRVDGPMSFATKNAIRLEDLQDILVEIVRPEIDTARVGFPGLSTEQRAFLVEALGQLPSESRNPRFDPVRVPDHCCKFVLPGVRRVVPAEHVRVYDKIGRAYGFSIENAWIEDRRTGRGFFLAVVLYTNSNRILNDDDYDYETLADPFLEAVGEVIASVVFETR